MVLKLVEQICFRLIPFFPTTVKPVEGQQHGTAQH